MRPISLRCREGIHAAIAHTHVPASLGRVVKVLAMPLIVPSTWPKSAPWPAWECEAVQEIPCDQGVLKPGDRCLIPDAWLAPFTPGAERQLQKALFTAKLGALE
jgi:hypothetical protein